MLFSSSEINQINVQKNHRTSNSSDLRLIPKLILIICNWSMSCNRIEYAAERLKNRKISRAEETRKQICQDFINKTLSRKRYKLPKAPDSKKNGKDLKIDCDAVQLVQII